MADDGQIRRLRAVFEPFMVACKCNTPPDTPDDAFCGRLRRCLMSLTGGDEPAGFDYQCTRTPAGDFHVVLEWRRDLEEPPSSAPAIFVAHGTSESEAFLRAAELALNENAYREMLWRRI